MTVEVNRLPRPDAAKHPGDFPFELFPGQLKTPPKNSGFRLRTRCQSPFRKRSTPALVVVIGPNSRRYIQAARRCFLPGSGFHTQIRGNKAIGLRSEEHTSELQSRPHLVCRLLLEKKNEMTNIGVARNLRKWLKRLRPCPRRTL